MTDRTIGKGCKIKYGRKGGKNKRNGMKGVKKKAFIIQGDVKIVTIKLV